MKQMYDMVLKQAKMEMEMEKQKKEEMKQKMLRNKDMSEKMLRDAMNKKQQESAKLITAQTDEISKLKQEIINEQQNNKIKKEQTRLAARKVIEENEKEKRNRLIQDELDKKTAAAEVKEIQAQQLALV